MGGANPELFERGALGASDDVERVWIDREQMGIERAVQGCVEWQTVARVVSAVLGIRLEVCRFDHLRYCDPREGTMRPIALEDAQLETALPRALADVPPCTPATVARQG